MNQREQIENQIIEKAMKDADFRRQLFENTHETLENELGISIPRSMNIHILEESKDHFYLVLPDSSMASEPVELTENELQAVSGGGTKLYTTGPHYCNIWNFGS